MQCQVCSILKDKPGEKKLWVFPTSTTLNLKTTGLGFKEYLIEFSIKGPFREGFQKKVNGIFH